MLLDTAFINVYVKKVSLEKQTIYPNSLSSVARIDTDLKGCLIVLVGDMAESSVCRRVEKMVSIAAMPHVLALVQNLATGLQVVEIYLHLMCRGRAMIARGLLSVTADYRFTSLTAIWSKIAATVPNDMLVARCTTFSDTL